ncbi:MAG: hypothetical protein QG549_203 [Patescibacteria group bacterium]|jgi:3-methyladenine DNA glycosylase AlkD|nr:hypothetical protein [Patescibacteria group bacterium]
MKSEDVQAALRAQVDPAKAAFFPRFFKTGPGQYGEGDKFLGVTVPNTRAAVKPFQTLPLAEAEQLLLSEWHEDRLAALFILVWQYPRADEAKRKEIYDFYLSHARCINNWDLVDTSAEHIVGPYLNNRPDKMTVLTRLAKSESLWERRIAMLATFHYIKQGRADEALDIVDILLHDQQDLIRKATGWMLREIGKRVDRSVLTAYLDQHAHDMPRTTLRYAIEHLPPEQKLHYMQLKP